MLQSYAPCKEKEGKLFNWASASVGWCTTALNMDAERMMCRRNIYLHNWKRDCVSASEMVVREQKTNKLHSGEILDTKGTTSAAVMGKQVTTPSDV